MRVQRGDWHFRGATIKIDGAVCLDVFEADDEAGYVILFVRDASGNLVIDGDEKRTERRDGVVEIVLKDGIR